MFRLDCSKRVLCHLSLKLYLNFQKVFEIDGDTFEKVVEDLSMEGMLEVQMRDVIYAKLI